MVTGFPVAQPIPEQGRVKTVTLPGGLVAIATHMGPYDTLEHTYRAMWEEISRQGYKPAGSMWEYYFSDPGLEPDSSMWRTDIYQPISK